ncbi:MAG: hypothetical protein WBP79_01385 [Candidatus Acidiferrales bacterium]
MAILHSAGRSWLAMHAILKKLSGGDRRSIGRSNEVVAEVLARPALFRHVFDGLASENEVLRMRAADAAEKIAARRPELLRPFKRKLLALAGGTEQQEVRWHTALMIPRLDLTPRERGVAVDILFDYLRDRSSIVKTFAMHALADLASKDSSLLTKILPLLEELTEIGTPAIRARGRKILQHLNRQRAKA